MSGYSTEDDDKFDEDQLDQMREIMDERKNDSHSRFQVSSWDDDTDGIEEEKDPHRRAETEILWAAENGELDIIKDLISLNKSLLLHKDKDGYTPLHRACYNNHEKVVEYLLSIGADYSSQTEDNWQPLHSACRWNNARIAVMLLDAGADINALTTGNQTPLHLAASNGNAKETLQLLIMNKSVKHDILNDSNETAYDIAKRSGKYYRLFEILEPCINQI